jgi:hypothetical protein
LTWAFDSIFNLVRVSKKLRARGKRQEGPDAMDVESPRRIEFDRVVALVPMSGIGGLC